MSGFFTLPPAFAYEYSLKAIDLLGWRPLAWDLLSGYVLPLSEDTNIHSNIHRGIKNEASHGT